MPFLLIFWLYLLCLFYMSRYDYGNLRESVTLSSVMVEVLLTVSVRLN